MFPQILRYTLLPAAGLAILAALALLYATAPQLYAEILGALGLAPFRYPFLDGQYVLAGAECWHFGINVYVSDPCDVLDRAHAYSPLWLRLPVVPMSMTMPLGVGMAGVFVLSLAVVAPIRRGRDFVLCVLATTSPTVIFALERANADIIVFLLVVAAGLLWPRLSSGWRLVAYAPPLLAALLKYYPITLLCLAIRERPRVFAAVIGVALATLVVFITEFRAELLASLPNIPGGGYAAGMFGAADHARGYFTDNFGAIVLPGGINEILQGAGLAPQSLLYPALFGSFVGAAVLRAFRSALAIVNDREISDALAALPARANFFLVSGAALIAGCFFAGQSVNYRGIHLLFVLPAFLTLSDNLRTGHGRLRFQQAGIIVVLLMWGDSIRYWLDELGFEVVRIVIWFVRELFWWHVVGVLVGALLCSATVSPLAQEVSAKYRKLTLRWRAEI
ncbi:MAG TPA: hypothetical protein VGU20_20185 [Stellaceae bacterium]|nr:hypothetical protein [Stellaceae bacterium]